MRGVGDSQTPFYFLILSTVAGIVLTPALIRGWFGLPQFGVASAAVAPTLATIAGLVVLRRRGSPLAFDGAMLHALHIRPAILRALVAIGPPTGVQLVMARSAIGSGAASARASPSITSSAESSARSHTSSTTRCSARSSKLRTRQRSPTICSC
jgi:hypothetical protein